MSAFSADDHHWMQYALAFAETAATQSEVPVGAVLIRDNSVIAAAANQPIQRNDPTAHAEILALRQGAQSLANYRLPGTTLYVTLEPCVMCAGALIHARVTRVVFAAYDPKAGAAGSCFDILNVHKLNHRIQTEGGLMEDASKKLLQAFFQQRR